MAWKDGKQWVYSITYDEGCQALLEHSLPIHRRYGVPGHVCIVSREVGRLRCTPGSSYEGMMILSRDELRGLAAEGWGLSCHSMTHAAINDDNAEYEVVEAKGALEEATGLPVSVFCVPGNNDGYPPALKVAAAGGYDAIMTIYDDINRPDVDLLRLCRVPLTAEHPGPLFSAYDRFKRLHQAIEEGGWVIDCCHSPRPDRPVHPWKDCTTEQLDRRFETVCALGGDDVWLAEPNEVVEYLLRER